MTVSVVSLIVGTGLLALAALPLGSGVPEWLRRVDLLFCALSFILAIVAHLRRTTFWLLTLPSLLAVGLAASAIAALATVPSSPRAWWTFAAAFVYFMLAMNSASRREWQWDGEPSNMTTTGPRESDRPRDAA
jgi:uncharacterized membrane protein YoaK (UPF0700 family)